MSSSISAVTTMDWLQQLSQWAQSHETALWWLFAASVAMFLLTPIAVTWLVVRLPEDYFARPRRHAATWWQQNPMLRPAVLVVKNLVGVLLLLAGLIMLMVPGQGLLTIAAGLMLLDFPGKFRVERWLATRRPLWRSINWLRKRAGRAALQRPE